MQELIRIAGLLSIAGGQDMGVESVQSHQYQNRHPIYTPDLLPDAMSLCAETSDPSASLKYSIINNKANVIRIATSRFEIKLGKITDPENAVATGDARER
jgi:hypothetical protein